MPAASAVDSLSIVVLLCQCSFQWLGVGKTHAGSRTDREGAAVPLAEVVAVMCDRVP